MDSILLTRVGGWGSSVVFRFGRRFRSRWECGCGRTRRRISTTTTTTTTTTGGPVAEYDQRVRKGVLKDDEHQRAVIGSLQGVYDRLVGRQRSMSMTDRLFGWTRLGRSSKTDDEQVGVYLYGDVGCGKTMLMELLYDSVPVDYDDRKKRIHFNDFMQLVHQSLHRLKRQSSRYTDESSGNSVDGVADEIATRWSVLCFDEFQCTDIGDAMILRQLLTRLISRGVVLIVTSNRHPDELYKNGIQRQSFIPAIELIKRRLRVIHLDSPTDYRRIERPGGNVSVFHHPLGPAADVHADVWFRRLGSFDVDPPHPTELTVWGRPIKVPLSSGRAARFSFNHLLGASTSAADYIELANRYSSFIVTDVPIMTFETRHLARRFITFVDAVYESKGRLVMTMEERVDRLFQADLSGSTVSGEEERFAFGRAASRLSQMGTADWIGRTD